MLTVTSIQETMDLHESAAYGKKVDYLEVTPEDAKRRRFRAETLDGLEINISLDRNTELKEGSLLYESDDYIVLLRIRSPSRLLLQPHTSHAALQLGFLAGHLHWKVQIHEDTLRVDVETEVAEYQARLDDYLDRDVYDLSVESDENHGRH